MATQEIPAFLCYRRVDGSIAAQLIFRLLNQQRVRLKDIEEGEVRVYYDEKMDAYADWTSHQRPALEQARVMIIVITPGLSADLRAKGKPDWVRMEINWWLRNRRDVQPILIDCTGEGTRFLPGKAPERWENVQVLRLNLAEWETLTEPEVRQKEESLTSQVLGGIRDREGLVRYQDVERLHRLLGGYKIASTGATAFGAMLIVAVIWLYSSLQNSRIERDNARAMSWVSEAEKDAFNYPNRSLDLIAGALEVAPDNSESANRATETAFDLFAHRRGHLYSGVADPSVSAMTDDGRWLAIGGRSGALVVRDLKTNSQKAFFANHSNGDNPEAISFIQFVCGGKYLLVANLVDVEESQDVWVGEVDSVIGRMQMHKLGIADVNCVASDPAGKWVAIGGENGAISFYQLSHYLPFDHPAVVLNAHAGKVTTMGWSCDGKLLASGYSDGSMRLWDLQHAPSLEHSLSFIHSDGEVNAISFSTEEPGEEPRATLLFTGTRARIESDDLISKGRAVFPFTGSMLRMWRIPVGGLPLRALPRPTEVRTTFNVISSILPNIHAAQVSVIGYQNIEPELNIRHPLLAMETYLRRWSPSDTLSLVRETDGEKLNDAALTPDSTQVVAALEEGGLEMEENGRDVKISSLDGPVYSISTWSGGLICNGSNGYVDIIDNNPTRSTIGNALGRNDYGSSAEWLDFSPGSDRLLVSHKSMRIGASCWVLGKDIVLGSSIIDAEAVEQPFVDSNEYVLSYTDADSMRLIRVNAAGVTKENIQGRLLIMDRQNMRCLLRRSGKLMVCPFLQPDEVAPSACQPIEDSLAQDGLFSQADPLLVTYRESFQGGKESVVVNWLKLENGIWKIRHSRSFSGTVAYWSLHWLVLKRKTLDKKYVTEIWDNRELSSDSAWIKLNFEVNGPCLVADDRWIVLFSFKKTDYSTDPNLIRILDLKVQSGKYREFPVDGIKISYLRRGNSWYIGTATGSVWKGQVVSGEMKIDSFQAHDTQVVSMALSKDGNLLVTGDLEGTIKVWNLRSPGLLPITIKAFTGAVEVLKISDDSRWIAASSADEAPRVYCLDRKLLAAAARQYSGRDMTAEEKKKVWIAVIKAGLG